VGIGGTVLCTLSPQQAAQERAVPVLPIPTAVVVRQELADKTEVQCSFSSTVVEALAPVSAGKFRSRVVTALKVAAGDALNSGTVVGSVSGRPLIAFTTTLPFYRDLKVGDRGADVKALESGLVAAKRLAKADSVFGADTLGALRGIYRSAGLGSPEKFVLDAAWGVPKGSRVAQVLVSVGDVVGKDTALVSAASGAGDWACELFGVSQVNVGDVLEAKVDGESMKANVVGLSADGETGVVTAKVSLPTAEAGENEAAVIVVGEVSDGPVLTVPAGAVFSAPDGGFEVRVVVADQSTSVKVTVGVAAGGWVEITGDQVSEGDSVALRGGG
jgi:hypothetical protein